MQEKNKDSIKVINENNYSDNNFDSSQTIPNNEDGTEYVRHEFNEAKDSRIASKKAQNVILYLVILFFSYQFSMINFMFFAILLSPDKQNLPLTYVLVGLFSLALGAGTGFLLNKVSNDRFFLLGNIFISFFNATGIALLLIVIELLDKQVIAKGIDTSKILLSTNIGVANSFFIPLIVIICFNIFPYIIYNKREKKEKSALKYYAIAFIIFLIIYFYFPALIESFIQSVGEKGFNYSVNISG